MQEIIDDGNNSNLSYDYITLSYGAVNIFASIDNNMEIASVRNHFDESK